MKLEEISKLRRETADKVAELVTPAVKGIAGARSDREQLMLATMLHSTLSREEEMRMKGKEFADHMEKSQELHRMAIMVMDDVDATWESKAARLMRLIVRYIDSLIDE